MADTSSKPGAKTKEPTHNIWCETRDLPAENCISCSVQQAAFNIRRNIALSRGRNRPATTGQVEDLKRMLDESERRIQTPKRRSTGQKFKNLGEAVFGVIVSLGGINIKSTVLSLLVVTAGWALLITAVWHLNFLEQRKPRAQNLFNVLLSVVIGVFLFIVWWNARPNN